MERHSRLLRPAPAIPARLARWGRAALGLLYPKRCPFCDEVLGQLAACPASQAGRPSGRCGAAYHGWPGASICWPGLRAARPPTATKARCGRRFCG